MTTPGGKPLVRGWLRDFGEDFRVDADVTSTRVGAESARRTERMSVLRRRGPEDRAGRSCVPEFLACVIYFASRL